MPRYTLKTALVNLDVNAMVESTVYIMYPRSNHHVMYENITAFCEHVNFLWSISALCWWRLNKSTNVHFYSFDDSGQIKHDISRLTPLFRGNIRYKSYVIRLKLCNISYFSAQYMRLHRFSWNWKLDFLCLKLQFHRNICSELNIKCDILQTLVFLKNIIKTFVSQMVRHIPNLCLIHVTLFPMNKLGLKLFSI